jgi:hypothetical protein
MKKTLNTIRKGSALLVAILVMAILMTLTLGLSALVIREIRQTGDIVAAGKAFYAAEAGVEIALLELHEHLPGYQTKNVSGAADEWVSSPPDDEFLDYRYRIRNQGNRYPYFDDDAPVYLTSGIGVTKNFLYENGGPNEATYNVLGLNQTTTIPLFVDCGDGTFKDVKNFVLEYYVDFDTAPDNNLSISNPIQDFDVLRWKLFGQPNDPDLSGGGVSRTHAISDFYPAYENDSAENPVCIGSDLALAVDDNCIPLLADSANINKDYIANWDTENFDVSPVEAAWGVARECYAKDAGPIVAPSDIQKGCNIGSFMQTHKKNYFTITNVVNPDIVGISDPVIRNARANIYYRVVAEKDQGQFCQGENPNDQDVMVREYAAISSDGFASNKTVKQSVDVKLKLNSFLPVFNFTLFRTDPSKENLEDLPPDLLPL